MMERDGATKCPCMRLGELEAAIQAAVDKDAFEEASQLQEMADEVSEAIHMLEQKLTSYGFSGRL